MVQPDDTPVDPPGEQRNWILWPGLLVALGAVAATAHGLTEVALGAGVPEQLAWIYPLITDGLALVAYAATHVLGGKGRAYAWTVVVLSAGLSGLGQAAYLAGGVTTTPTVLRFGVGYWPAIAGAGAAHLLYLIGAAHRAKVAEAERQARERAEQQRRDEAARIAAEQKRREDEERREQRRAERAAAGTRRSTRSGTRPQKTPAKPSTGTPGTPVPAASTHPNTFGTEAGTEPSTPTPPPVLDAGTRLHIVTRADASTGDTPAAQWDRELWQRAVSTAREYWRENRADARIDDFQALGIGRNKAAELRRAVLASGEANTDPSTGAGTGAVPAADRATQ